MPTDMFRAKPKKGGSLAKRERAAAETQDNGGPGGTPTLSDFDHPMPRLMDYFRGKSMVEEVDSAAEQGGKREED